MPKMFDINYDRDNGKITVFIDDKMIIDYECTETYAEFRDVLDSIIVMAKYSGFMYTITANNRHDEDLKISKCQIEQALKEGRIKPEKIEETIEETINFQNKYSQISALCRKIVGKKR